MFKNQWYYTMCLVLQLMLGVVSLQLTDNIWNDKSDMSHVVMLLYSFGKHLWIRISSRQSWPHFQTTPMTLWPKWESSINHKLSPFHLTGKQATQTSLLLLWSVFLLPHDHNTRQTHLSFSENHHHHYRRGIKAFSWRSGCFAHGIIKPIHPCRAKVPQTLSPFAHLFEEALHHLPKSIRWA